MKTGWVLVIAVGLSAALVRIAGLAVMADLSAVIYLLTVTLVFEREHRAELAHVRASTRAGTPTRG